jgi:hypothetical protein
MSVRMGSVNLVVIVESMRSLIEGNTEEVKPFHLPSILAVASALGFSYLLHFYIMPHHLPTVVKVLLFVYCFSVRKKSSQVEVLWEDHRNDIFLNGFGILSSHSTLTFLKYLDVRYPHVGRW